MRSDPEASESSLSDSCLTPLWSASTITWNATISFLAPKMWATRPSHAEFRALAGCRVSSRSTFSPSLTAQTRRTPPLASDGARVRISVRRTACALIGLVFLFLPRLHERFARKRVRESAIGVGEDTAQRLPRLAPLAQRAEQHGPRVFGQTRAARAC